MDFKNLLKFLRIVENIPLEYMISGSIASIFYGKPRLTQDMDLVVIFPLSKVVGFTKSFDLQDYYCPPPEMIEEAIHLGAKGHLNVIDQHTGYKIDIYPAGNDPLILWGFEHRKREDLIPGEEVWIAPAEYVIVKKLEYYKEAGSQKHLEDIGGMLEVQGDKIDKKTIQSWTAKLGLLSYWENACAKNPI